jgi:hypothetical protein
MNAVLSGDLGDRLFPFDRLQRYLGLGGRIMLTSHAVLLWEKGWP